MYILIGLMLFYYCISMSGFVRRCSITLLVVSIPENHKDILHRDINDITHHYIYIFVCQWISLTQITFKISLINFLSNSCLNVYYNLSILSKNDLNQCFLKFHFILSRAACFSDNVVAWWAISPMFDSWLCFRVFL